MLAVSPHNIHGKDAQVASEKELISACHHIQRQKVMGKRARWFPKLATLAQWVRHFVNDRYDEQ